MNYPRLVLVPIVVGCAALLAACGSDETSTITFSKYDGTTGNIYAMNPDGTNER